MADTEPVAADSAAAILLNANPFPGLRAFNVSEAKQFFGRREQIAELIQRLSSVPLLAVAGESGCGKSSLVLAGLLSELAGASAAGSAVQWLPVVMRPGSQPVASLARALASVLDEGGAAEEDIATRAASLDGSLRLGSLGLVEIVGRARLQPSQRLLVVVDQFEEIFRFSCEANPGESDSCEAAVFVKLLLTAANDPQVQLSTVLTLRSNALGRCADFRGLPEAINRGQYLVPKLTREQRKQAIVAPVEAAGQRIAPRLVQRLLNDVSDDFDDLPVMQHALSRTWQQWARSSSGARAIDLEDYEAIGTSTHALSWHADEAAASLGEWQPWVEPVFRALTELTPEGSTNRRPLRFSTLNQVVAAPAGAVAAVVERFRRPDTALLMPPISEFLEADPVIDISHESLIRLWPALRQWAKAEAEAKAQAVVLVNAAQNEAELLRGIDLKRALAWQRREEPNAAWIALCTDQEDGADCFKLIDDYLSASEAAARREKLRRRALIFVLCGLPVLIVIGSVAAAVTADKLQRQARSSELASLALLRVNQDPAYAARLALAALDRDGANAKAEFALRQSWSSLETARAVRIVNVQKGQPIVDMRFTQDRKQLLVATTRSLHLLDATSLENRTRPLEVQSDLVAAWPVDNGKLVLAHFADGRVRLLAMDGTVAQVLFCPAIEPATGDEPFVSRAVASPDGHEVAIGCYDGAIVRWSVDGGRVGKPRHWPRLAAVPSSTTALQYSHDSQYFASGDINGTVRIWQRGKDKPLFGSGELSSPKHRRAVSDIVFKEGDPSWLATGSDDLRASVWRLDLKRGRLAEGESQWHFEHERPVGLVRFYQRGKNSTRLMVVADTRVYFWGPSGKLDQRAHSDWIAAAQASDDGNFVVSASSDGTARVWSTVNAAPVALLAGHSDGVNRALFVPGQEPGKMNVITAGADGTVRRWDLHPPRMLLASKKWLLSASMAPDGQRVAACGEPSWALGDHCALLSLNAQGTEVAGLAEQPGWRARGNSEFGEFGEFDSVAWTSFSADGKWLLGSGSRYGIHQTSRCKFWNAAGDDKPLMKISDGCTFAAFSAKSDWLLTVGDNGQMALWNTAALNQPAPVAQRVLEPNSSNGFASTAISPDGRWVAAADGKDAQLWDLQQVNGPPRRLGPAHHGNIRGLSFSADSRRLVTASMDRSARVWRLLPERGLSDSVELAGSHTAALVGASFSPNGKLVATFGADATIRIWNAANGRELTVLRWHDRAVNDAQFTTAGDAILSASDDGTVKLGRCDACLLTIEALREKLAQTPLSNEDEKRLANETLHLPWYRRWF